MSAAAKKLAAAAPTIDRRRHGPANLCGNIYAPDVEDAEAIDEFRHRQGESWLTAQRNFDRILGVTQPITNDKFRYHWRRRCGCWPDDLRQS